MKSDNPQPGAFDNAICEIRSQPGTPGEWYIQWLVDVGSLVRPAKLYLEQHAAVSCEHCSADRKIETRDIEPIAVASSAWTAIHDGLIGDGPEDKYWLALSDGRVVAGQYKWKFLEDAIFDGFDTTDGRIAADDVTHFAPCFPPAHPNGTAQEPLK